MTIQKQGIRPKKNQQVIGPGNYVFASWFVEGIVQSAHLLLLAARDERKPHDGENHLTQHGPAAILVAVTALECLVNQTLQHCFLLHNRTAFEKLVQRDSLVEKLQEIPRLASGSGSVTADIELVQHVRNEIAHHYPRDVGPTHVPEWLRPLADKGLFCAMGIAPQDIGWQQKIQSFQLARWCAAVTCQTAQQFVTAVRGDEDQQSVVASIADTAKISAAYFQALLV
jgi:hypothetical protein